jgi:hypothetical protein
MVTMGLIRTPWVSVPVSSAGLTPFITFRH